MAIGNGRQKLDIAKAILWRHYRDTRPPDGLLISIYKALGEAEMRGFEDCMLIFEPRLPANDSPPNPTDVYGER